MARRWPVPRLAFRRPRADAAGGAEERFRQAILPHLDAAYSYARYLSRDAVASEDIVQEAFLRAFRSLDGCHGNEKAWLFAIVRNCFHDWTRTSRREGLGEPAADPEHEDEGALGAIEQGTMVAQLRVLIGLLPEPFREALVLRELEDLSYREIAEATGAPIGTVMSRLARAREMLTVMLRGDEEVATDTIKGVATER